MATELFKFEFSFKVLAVHQFHRQEHSKQAGHYSRRCQASCLSEIPVFVVGLLRSLDVPRLLLIEM